MAGREAISGYSYSQGPSSFFNADQKKLKKKESADAEKDIEVRYAEQISGFTRESSQYTEEYWNISTSPENGSIDMISFKSMYDPEIIEEQCAYGERIQNRPETNRLEYSVYIEKFIPIALMWFSDYFIDEIGSNDDDLEEFYTKYNFSEDEQEMFSLHAKNVPDVIPLISAVYDDVKHKRDFIIQGDSVLAGVDITTASWHGTVYGEKEIDLAECNVLGFKSNVFYGFIKNEDSVFVPASPTIASTPHLLLRFPKTQVSTMLNIFDNLNFPLGEIYEKGVDKELQKDYTNFALFIIRCLSESLEEVSDIFYRNRELLRSSGHMYKIGHYIEETRKQLSIPNDKRMTAGELGKEAIAERFRCVETLRAIFYCMKQFALKKLERLAKENKAI